MSQIYLSVCILVLIFLNSLKASDTSHIEFKMLESYQITGLIPDINDSYGVAFRDFTNDGYPDIYLVCFRNLSLIEQYIPVWAVI